MKKQYIYSILFLFVMLQSYAQQTPASPQKEDYCIEGATAHIGDGTVIENSLLMFSKGKLTFVGSANARIARRGTIIQAKGKHVYPGFIVCNASIGLTEIDAVRATEDHDEVGAMNPHIRSLIAYNTESKIVESMRPNGVLMAQITPRGGTISGTSSVVQLDAWNWEDASIKTDDGIHLNWPSTFSRGRWWLGESAGPNKNYSKGLQDITTYFNAAKKYLNSNVSVKNLPYEALKTLFNGGQKLYVHANGEKAILDAISFCKSQRIKMVLVHGTDADKVAKDLIENNIPVILERSHRLPNNEDTDYDKPYRSAKELTEKGVTVSIGMEGSMERMSTRNLPFYAGTYAAYGMKKEDAVKMITLNAAKILGIEDKVGSLTVGKDATLFISEGDALDMRTNKLSDAYIQGRKISLESHQTKLWKRYSKKYNQ